MGNILIGVLRMDLEMKYFRNCSYCFFLFLRHFDAPRKNVKLECGTGCPGKNVTLALVLAEGA